MHKRKLQVLDLFSGIGGFSLGLETTGGFETAAFCEIDPFARSVLTQHWPAVKQYTDITKLTKEQLDADGIGIDVITGGFPCQDISAAGRGAGITGARSSLWFEYLRVIDEVGPSYVIIENSPVLRSRGLEVVLGGLAQIGFDAEWHCVPARAVGAPHRRDRIWIVAYPNADRRGLEEQRLAQHGEQQGEPGDVADGLRAAGRRAGASVAHAVRLDGEPAGGTGDVPRAPREAEGEGLQRERGEHPAHGGREDLAHPGSARGAARVPAEGHREEGHAEVAHHLGDRLARWTGGDQWATEPDVGRVAHGVPARVDRLRCLGNAVVPAIPHLIGLAILARENEK